MNTPKQTESRKGNEADSKPSEPLHQTSVRDLNVKRDPKGGITRNGDPDEGGQFRCH